MMTGVLNTIKLSKHKETQRAQNKETTETRTVITSNCSNKKEIFIVFYAKHVNKFVSSYQGQTPVFKKGFTY